MTSRSSVPHDADISAAAKDVLPPDSHELVDRLHAAKTTDAAPAPLVEELLDLFRLCEASIAGAPRLRAPEFAPGPGEEGWWYDADSLSAETAPAADYRRFARPDENYTVWFRGDWMRGLAAALCRLAEAYLGGADPSPDLAWLPSSQKAARLCLILSQLTQTRVFEIPEDLLTRLQQA